MNTTDILALWGALVATSVLSWDILKWKTEGPKIRISANANIKVLGDSEDKLVLDGGTSWQFKVILIR